MTHDRGVRHRPGGPGTPYPSAERFVAQPVLRSPSRSRTPTARSFALPLAEAARGCAPSHAEGTAHAPVDGEMVLTGGGMTAVLPGRVLRGPAWVPPADPAPRPPSSPRPCSALVAIGDAPPFQIVR